MGEQWPDLSDIEARVTASDRLDLHFEHRDALDVERGSWNLAEHLQRFAELQVCVGDHTVRGGLLAVGSDWVQLTTAIVRLDACDEIRPFGSGQPVSTVLSYRQAVRQLAGRVPREVVLRRGRSQLMSIDWVARDFLQARVEGRPALIPLGQIAAVFGRIEFG